MNATTERRPRKGDVVDLFIRMGRNRLHVVVICADPGRVSGFVFRDPGAVFPLNKENNLEEAKEVAPGIWWVTSPRKTNNDENGCWAWPEEPAGWQPTAIGQMQTHAFISKIEDLERENKRLRSVIAIIVSDGDSEEDSRIRRALAAAVE